MNKEIEQVKKHVAHLHGAPATFVESVHVTETFKGNVVWDGIVHVFNLEVGKNHIKGYGWAMTKKGASEPQYVAVLGYKPINSAQDAVKAAIVQEYREGKA